MGLEECSTTDLSKNFAKGVGGIDWNGQVKASLSKMPLKGLLRAYLRSRVALAVRLREISCNLSP